MKRLLPQLQVRFIVQVDGAHQSLVNELQNESKCPYSGEVWVASGTPTPTPISRESRAACVGTEFILKWMKSRPHMGARLVHINKMNVKHNFSKI